MGKSHFLQMGNACWSQLFPSLWGVLSSEGSADCLVADLSGRVWLTQCPVTTKQSPIVRFGIPPLNTVLISKHSILADLLPIYVPSLWVSWWAPPTSLPPMGHLRISVLFSSFLCRVLHLIFRVSNHLSHCSAHSNAEVEHMQYNPARQKGPSVAGTLFRCCLSVHRLLLSCPGSVSPWMTALKPWSFRSSCLHERWWGVLSGL